MNAPDAAVAAGPVRCSVWARSEGLSPAGTAGTPAGFVVVDRALPWPRDIGEIDDLAGTHELARAHGLRVQARVPAERRTPRVTLYRTPPAGSFAGYAVAEGVVGEDGGDAAEVLLTLLRSPVGTPAAAGAGEVLVCTHGRRDTCCGAFGSTLAVELGGPAGAGIGRRVGRTSHTGGHRFAPTAILLPEGTAWAFADADLLRRVSGRHGPLDDVVGRYRGCTGLGSPAVQAVEAAVLGEVGWDLFDQGRQGSVDDDGRVRLTASGAGGTVAVWEAEVVAGRTLAVPDCGRPLDEARKSETERVVRGLRRVA